MGRTAVGTNGRIAGWGIARREKGVGNREEGIGNRE
jgi:hypothetical protein